MRIRVVTLALLLLAASQLFAQKAALDELGFHPEKLYDFSQVDSVNLFNGNLIISIPIGPRYSVSSTLSYQFMLVYNGKTTDEESWCEDPFNQGCVGLQIKHITHPNLASNAGNGWRVSLGRLLPPVSTGRYQDSLDNDVWIYEGPAGDEHMVSDPNAMSGMRMRVDPNDSNFREVEFGSGEIRRFKLENNVWRLTQIRDRFNNQVNITYNYSTDGKRELSWTIQDTANRTHYVTLDKLFTGMADGWSRGQMVTKLDLQAYGGTTATYTLDYDTSPGDIGLLKSLTQPDGTKYTLDSTSSNYWGELLKMQYPTGGTVSYTYGTYAFAPSDSICAIDYSQGVTSRTIADGATTRKWDYLEAMGYRVPATPLYSDPCGVGDGSLNGPFYWSRTSVLAPLDATSHRVRTDHYFSIFADATATTPYEFTVDSPLPGQGLQKYTHSGAIGVPPASTRAQLSPDYTPGAEVDARDDATNSATNPSRLLATEIYSNCNSTGDCTNDGTTAHQGKLLRSSYDRYIGLIYPKPQGSHGADEARLLSSRTVFEDDAGCGALSNEKCYTQSVNSRETDATMQFRTVTTTSNFPNAKSVVETTEYLNWSAAELADFSTPFLLNTFTEKTKTENGVTATEQFCFDVDPANALSTGALLRHRVLAGSTPQSNDVLTVYDYDAHGNPQSLSSYGGDVSPRTNDSQSLGTSSLCSMTLPSAPAYQVKQSFVNGVLATSEYWDPATNQSIGFKNVDRTIDPSTGVVTAARDTTGQHTTSFAYSALPVRLDSVTSATGATTTYTYTNASGTAGVSGFTNAKVTSRTPTTSSGTLQEQFVFDGLGRLFRRSHVGPAGNWIASETTFDEQGRVASVSTPESTGSAPPAGPLTAAHKSTTTYDAFNRPLVNTAPDGKSITLEYTGVREQTRTAAVATSATAETNVRTKETYDQSGRLVGVTENAGDPAHSQTTSYTYDVAGRLTGVTQPGQTRAFHYDLRGFLLWEQHPELGKTGGGKSVYGTSETAGSYDALGHPHHKYTVSGTDFALDFKYDTAERLNEVDAYDRSGNSRILKQFEFDKASDFPTLTYPGKLFRSTRHNYEDDYTTGDIVVSERYLYDGLGGTISKKVTCVDFITTPDGQPCHESSSTARLFTPQFTYNELGKPATLQYPDCTGCGAGTVPKRVVTDSYSFGLLSGVTSSFKDGTGANVGTLGYGSEGLLATINHGDTANTADVIAPDPNGMARPQSISFTNWTDNCTPPAITNPPSSVSTAEGETVTLSVTASGTAPTFQWYRGTSPTDATLLDGATSSTYVLTLTRGTAANYFVRITNACGTVDSTPAAVTIGCTPFTIVGTSGDMQVQTGDDVTLFVNVNAGIEPAYSWSEPGVTTCNTGDPCKALESCNTYQCPVAGFSGDHHFRVTLTPKSADSCSTTLTADVHVQAIGTCPDLTITQQPQDASIVAGEPTYLSVSYTGPSSNVTWEKRTLALNEFVPAGTGNPLTVNPTVSTEYRALITPKNGCRAAAPTNVVVVHVTACGEITVTSQPQDQRVVEGNSATLEFNATSSQLQYYSWYRGTTGDTSHNELNSGHTTFVTPPLTDDTDYWGRISSSNCAVDSRTVHVSVCHPPSVISQPVPRTLTPGEDGVFGVLGHGSGLHYQWYIGPAHDPVASTKIGYDQSTVHVTITQTSTIWVRITGECGTIDSDGATALYCVPPAFTSVPPDQVVNYGAQPAFTVAVDQSNVHYEWSVLPAGADNWIAFGGDSPSAQLPVIPAGNAQMRILARNANCYAYSRTVNLDICQPPSVTVVSSTQYITAGTGVILVAGWDQIESAMVSWYQGALGDKSHYVGGPNVEVHPDSSASYWIEVSNGRCATQSGVVPINVCKPRFSAQPQSQTVVAGVTPSAHLTVGAIGTPPVAYQWYTGTAGDKSNPIQGATTTDLTVSPTATTSYWVEASCACPISYPAAQSNTAVVTYCVPPSAPTPAPLVVKYGDAAPLSVSATGTNLHYRWYQGALGDSSFPLTGDAPQLTIPPFNSVAHYWVHITGDCGTIDVPVDVTICYPPAITTQPASVTIPDGSTTTLTVATSATGVTYQWYRGTWPDASNPVGTNSPSYTTPALSATTSYWVKVSGSQCAANSTTATVTVCMRPTITTQPLGASGVTSGNLVHLAVAASPGNPDDTLRYDWYSGASGNTSQVVYLNGPASIDVAPAVTTSYWVRVTNSSCYRDSVSALVDVCIPKITQQPQDASIVQGNPVTLSVTANGTTPLTYQWYQGQAGDTSTPVQSGTASSITSTPNNTVSYWVLIKSPCNTTNPGIASRTVTVTVCLPAHITTNPTNVNINLGQSVTFTVAASGTNPRYAWYAGPVGTTTTQLGSAATLTFTPSDTTTVWARATADCGAPSDSTLATVDVCSPPAINTQPADKTIPSGSTATFTVAATGTSLTYQWYRGENTDTSQPITGATSASYTTPALTADTRYWVNVTSKNRCSTRSASAVAQMCVPPAASITPQSANISSGQSVILQVQPGAASYQWYTGASGNTANPIANATTYYYDAHPTGNTSYWVRVGNGICSSDSISVPINVCVPKITTQPASTSIIQWSSTTLSVTATSATGYQWYVGNVPSTVQPAANGTNATLTVSPSTTTTYWVRVTGVCGTVDSTNATVTVTPCTRPAIQTQPQSITIQRGTATTLSVGATGTNLTYQWYKSDPAGSSYVAAGTASTLNVAPTSSSSTYYVVVSNGCGSVTSSTVTITTVVCTNAAITSQPSNYTFQPGGSATFTVGATGTNLHYQWYKSDPAGATFVAVTGGTSSTLTIVPASSQANYYVKVWGDCGSVLTSVTVTATQACNPINIIDAPQSTTINSGQMILLSVDVTGTNPWYTWMESTDGNHYYNISNSPGVYVAPSVTSYYYCFIGNDCSSATTDVISVAVAGGGGVMAGQPAAQKTVNPAGAPKLHSASNGLASGTLAPVFTVQPVSATVPPGGTATLSVAADSGTYQWYASTDGATYQPIPNATDPILNVKPAERTHYFARVTNEWAALNSKVATVSVALAPLATPSYHSSTQDVRFTPGSPVALEVRASGANLHYQWFKSDPAGASYTAIGTDAPRLTDPPAGPEAIYIVRISNDAGFTDTQWIFARSTACAAPVITTQPQKASVHSGGSATIQVAATGSGLSYQWFATDAIAATWAAVADATGPSLTVTPQETRFYYCVITSSCGSAVTSAAVPVEVTN